MFKKEFESDYAGFTEDGARWLVENTDIKLVGKMEDSLFVASSTITYIQLYYMQDLTNFPLQPL